jgi:xanthine/CO dehydrogenase XdhC/CoxF family maturation factor
VRDGVGDGGQGRRERRSSAPTAPSSRGWIGGGCARGAVLKAAREALADGEPRMVSVQPENLLAELGVRPGEMREGVRFRLQHVPEQGHDGYFSWSR